MADLTPFPMMPPRSTERRLDHFDDLVYKGDPKSLLYRFIDALVGDAGAGSLIKEAFMARLTNSLETIYFRDLDYIFGSVSFMARSPAESYVYNPLSDMLTSDQWDEVRIKDAWYRDRVRQFFIACGQGGTPKGIRTCVQAAISVDCDLFESWRFLDNFELGSNVGRSPGPNRGELIIRPHKTSLSPQEFRLLRDMLDKIAPADSVMTISTVGLGVATPLPVLSITADSTYFEVQKVVTGTPVLQDLPAPELLAIDLDPTEQWLFSDSPELAPYAAFNITQEYGYHYLISGGSRSPIDSTSYGTLQADGTVKPEPNFELFQSNSQFTEWRDYETVDSPDNFPGGKFGLTPSKAPARNPDGSPYVFQYASQTAYVELRKAEVIDLGGVANDLRYRLPIQKETQTKRVYTPDLANAWSAPSKESSVTSSWTKRRSGNKLIELRNQIPMFVRSGQS